MRGQAPLFLVHRLSAEVGYLEEWSLLDRDHRDHSNSLSGATEALKASTLRLPISGKALVDIQDLKHAVSSAVDVMHAMVSSLFSLTLKVEEMNSVMADNGECHCKRKGFARTVSRILIKSSSNAAMQVTHCSMKTHIIQLSRI